MAEIIQMSGRALHAQVASRLRTLLVEGRIAPGAKLNERELSEQLGVSRTPLREAIRFLASEGLVDLVPNRGAVAAQLSETDIEHTFEVLAEMEGLCGALAARRITDAELSEITALHYEMLAAVARTDRSNYYRINALIHEAISAAARNPVLSRAYTRINARVQSLRYLTNQDSDNWALAVQEHQRMLDALQTRDANAMRQVLTEHLFNKRDTVLRLLRAGAITAVKTTTPQVSNT